MNENTLEYKGNTYKAQDTEPNSCLGCALVSEPSLRCVDLGVSCLSDYRKDKREIIWVTTGCEKLEPREYHFDDATIDLFAQAMKDKMALQRSKGYAGWDDPKLCSTAWLQEGLAFSIEKGDPVDIGNYAMMLFYRSQTDK